MSVITRFLILSLLIAFPSIVVSADLQTADSLYSEFQYEDAADLYRNLLNEDTIDAVLMLKLGRCLSDIAELQPEDKQLVLYEEASRVLKDASGIDPDNAEIHFQIARTQGRISLFKGIWKSIGLAKEVRREADAALAINPEHDGALHILGRWHREASNKPKIIRAPLGLGSANKEDAFKCFKRALEIKPGFINHHLELGKTYISVKKYPEARHQLYMAKTLEPLRPIDKKYIEEAKKLLVEIEGKS